MINVNEFNPGITFELENEIYVVLESQHSKQGRGVANVKAKVKNLRSGAITIKNFTGGDKVKPAFIEKRKFIYLYNTTESCFFMDEENFEQIEIPLTRIQDSIIFLKSNDQVQIRFYKSEILDIELKDKVALKVENSPEAIKGNTVNNATKKAILETGLEIDVPLFIKEGDVVLVSTTTKKYVERVNKKN